MPYKSSFYSPRVMNVEQNETGLIEPERAPESEDAKKRREYQKRYRAEHKEHIKEYNHKYYQEHKEELSEMNKKWMKEHREKRNAWQRQWAKDHPLEVMEKLNRQVERDFEQILAEYNPDEDTAYCEDLYLG